MIILRNISDLVFGVNVLFFTYARIVLFSNVAQLKQHWRISVIDEHHQYAKVTRLFQLLCFGMNFVGIWWVVQSWRVIGTKIIEMTSNKKQ